jgi:hypothetical protein
VGFEPTVTHKATTVFETVPFNRSGTSPKACQEIDYLAFINTGIPDNLTRAAFYGGAIISYISLSEIISSPWAQPWHVSW